jgi:hypothetical protein
VISTVLAMDDVVHIEVSGRAAAGHRASEVISMEHLAPDRRRHRGRRTRELVALDVTDVDQSSAILRSDRDDDRDDDRRCVIRCTLNPVKQLVRRIELHWGDQRRSSPTHDESVEVRRLLAPRPELLRTFAFYLRSVVRALRPARVTECVLSERCRVRSLSSQ